MVSRASRQFGRGVNSAIFNLFLLALGYSKTFLSGLLSLSTFTQAIASLAAGPYTQRTGERNAMVVASMVTVIAASVQVAYPEAGVLLAMAVVSSIGVGLTITSYSPLLAASSEQYERAHLFGTSQAVSIGFSFIGSILGGFLPGWFALSLALPLDSGPSFQLALAAWFLPTAISIFPLLFIRETPEPTSKEVVDTPVPVEPKGHRIVFVKFAITSSIIGLGAGFIVPFMNVWFWELYDMPTHIVGVITGLGQGTLAAGVLLAPVLSTRIGKVNTVVITQAFSLPFIVLLATVVNPLIAVAAFLLRGVLMNASMPVNSALRMEIVPKGWRPNLNAIYSAADRLTRSFSTQVTGPLFDQGQYLLPFWYTLGCYSVSTVLYGLFFRGAERRLDIELKAR
ncbi:MAG: MFS transporter [Promethearchaeota archaeon]